jgi:hypothetical protein
MTTPLAILLVLAIVVLVPPRESRTDVPEPPPRPKHATEYRGPASDGGRVIVRRAGAWIWVRVESEGTANCRPEGSMRNGWVVMESPRGVRKDGGFVLRDEYWTTADVDRERRAWPDGRDGNPMHVSYRISGRFAANGEVTGSFARRDRIHGDGGAALDCRRGSRWTARPE